MFNIEILAITVAIEMTNGAIVMIRLDIKSRFLIVMLKYHLSFIVAY